MIHHEPLDKYHGVASLGGNWIEMYVPIPQTLHRTRMPGLSRAEQKYWNGGKRKRIMKSRLFEPVIFAQILAHEIDHNLSLRHEQMASAWSFEADYAKEIFVEPNYPKPKPKLDHVKIRHDRAIANFKKAQTRHRRATTLLNKWKKKVKYYEDKSVV